MLAQGDTEKIMCCSDTNVAPVATNLKTKVKTTQVVWSLASVLFSCDLLKCH
jgi:hypothetical protein